MSAFFEPLETRQLMSTSLVNGVLTVIGTALPDVIAVAQASGKLNVTLNGALSSFNATSVKKLIIDALAGNDVIRADMTVTKPLSLRGGEGNDTLTGGARGDSYNGGPGTDTADYSSRTDNLSISLDNIVNDGAAGENDNVKADVENVRTGSGDDVVRGSTLDNVIETSNGNDTVYAGAGNDTVRGGWGNDYLNGEEGNDTMYGQSEFAFRVIRRPRFGKLGGIDFDTGSLGQIILLPVNLPDNDIMNGGDGSDTIHGNAGNDTINGGAWRDSIFGDEGDDSISGGTGDDIIEGGDGNDTVWGNEDPAASRFRVRLGDLGGVFKLSTARTLGLGDLGGIIFKPGPILFPTVISDVDVVFGGAGNDSIHGNADGDSLSGGDGNDKIWGDAGDDVLRGNRGNDSLYGGAGNDNLGGDDGDDILVAIGGGTRDSLFGSAGSDQYWQDDADTETNDADLGEILFGNIHKVASFSNGVSKELNGQNFADPNATATNTTFVAGPFGIPIPQVTVTVPPYANFSTNPLFGPNGPQVTDIRQGGAGDCWFMSVLAGAAKQSSFRLTQRLVDLGDGTFAAEFRSGTDPVFIRVDADLPVTSAGSTTPYYAGLGAGNSIWAAIYEKAMCYFRSGTYQSIWNAPPRVGFDAMGFRDAGDLYVTNDGGTTLNNIRDALNSGKIVTLSTKNATVPGDIPAIQNHAYVVDHVNTTRMFLPFIGWIDVVTSVTCRNPWGRDGAGNDGNTADGLVTFTADHLQRFFTNAQAAWSL